jgi:acetyltransferase-like isoleucine patch superfamily enzyme
MKSIEKHSAIENILVYLYGRMKRRVFRNLIIKFVYKKEKGEFLSQTLRKIFIKYYGVEIGMYTHGGCFIPGRYDRFTKIGRYCSIATTSSAMNRNHPMEFKSMHAYFFNPKLGVCSDDTVEYIPLDIGNDVWIGHNAIVMPNVKEIGDGAVIGAGAVVNKDVQPYAVVVGNPGRVVRFRFSEERIRTLLEEKWWEKEIDELKPDVSEFQKLESDIPKNSDDA